MMKIPRGLQSLQWLDSTFKDQYQFNMPLSALQPQGPNIDDYTQKKNGRWKLKGSQDKKGKTLQGLGFTAPGSLGFGLRGGGFGGVGGGGFGGGALGSISGLGQVAGLKATHGFRSITPMGKGFGSGGPAGGFGGLGGLGGGFSI